MSQFIFAILGLACGAICVFFATTNQRRKIEKVKQIAEDGAIKVKRAWDHFNDKRREFDAASQDLEKRTSQFEEQEKRFNAQTVSFDELQHENAILKRDLHNLHVKVGKLAIDRDVQQEQQDVLDSRSRDLGSRYLKETIKWVSISLSPNNYTACKQKLVDAIDWCRKIGFSVSADDEINLVADLKAGYEKAVRLAFQREEQARIKARLREEVLLQRERDREIQRLERERSAIQAALDKALADARDQHSAEVDLLRQRLAEAEERSRRAISQAQITRAGHVYVISNIGSFGHGVFKIGLTRRLEPDERIRELSGAAVPFPFDVHMMISCDDAPKLENTLHKCLHKRRVNKANMRKEYFKVDLEEIQRLVIQNHGQVDDVADAEALEYNQSLSMPDDDLEYIESVYDSVEEDEEGIDIEV